MLFIMIEILLSAYTPARPCLPSIGGQEGLAGVKVSAGENER